MFGQARQVAPYSTSTLISNGGQGSRTQQRWNFCFDSRILDTMDESRVVPLRNNAQVGVKGQSQLHCEQT